MMEEAPVEVIGNILSRLGGSHDIVRASTTCKAWREAYRKHIHTLCFSTQDWPSYRDFPTSALQLLISRTIFQTTGLQGLSITMDDVSAFSAPTVVSWLIHARKTLKTLCCNVKIVPDINGFEIFGGQKFEASAPACDSITCVEPNFLTFPHLRSLSLGCIYISMLDLNLLLSACPKIEALELVNLEIPMPVAPVTAELVLKGTLKYLKLDSISDIHFDTEKIAENLEIVDISHQKITWPKLYREISGSRKLKKLKLWEVSLDNEDVTVEVESIALGFPQLTHLSLNYDLNDGIIQTGLQGSTLLENVIVLELGWTGLGDSFPIWVEGFLKRCPNLKKLIVYGFVSWHETHEQCRRFLRFTDDMIELMSIYNHVESQFEFR